MATLTFQLVVGGITVTEAISPSNARTLQFIDDLIAGPYNDEIDDGVGGTRPRTQEETAIYWLGNLMAGQVAWAKGLRQDELDKAVAVADDLEGNL